MQVQGDEKTSLERSWGKVCPYLAGEFIKALVGQDVVRCIVMHRMPSNRSAKVLATLVDPLHQWHDARIVAVRLSAGKSKPYRSQKAHDWTSYDIEDLKKSLGEVKMHAPTQQANAPIHPCTHPPMHPCSHPPTLSSSSH